jgi:glycosyltransferase involved in cell wall biosynthesis
MREKDVFDQFIDSYEKGFWNQALQAIIPYPTVIYDDLYSKEINFSHFVNYADACVFKGGIEFQQVGFVLQMICEQHKSLKIILNEFLIMLKQEYLLFSCYIAPIDQILQFDIPPLLKHFFLSLKEEGCSQELLKNLLEKLPPLHQSIFKEKIIIKKGWEELLKSKPSLSDLIGEKNWIYKQPWHAFSYALPLHLIQLKKGDTPLIFLQPLEEFDYRNFLEPYCCKECILVFETISHFFQLMQFEDIHTFLIEPLVYVYILELYPNEQFLCQGLHWPKAKTLQPIFMLAQPSIEEAIYPLVESMTKCLEQPIEDFKHDTPYANSLYIVCIRIILKIQEHRYGKSRAIALSIEQGFKNWYDPHKGALPTQVDLGPLTKNYLEDLIKEEAKDRQVKAFAPKNTIRLAHIVPQIVDGGHAPTKLLQTLCSFADRNWFDIYILSTERLSNHFLSYPVTSYISSSSQEVGQKTINFMNALCIPVFIDPQSSTYELAIKTFQAYLQQLQIDIAIFHGPDEINSLIACSTEVPIRILFEHGTLPSYNCFDLLILSTEEAYQQNQLNFYQQKMESCVLPFSIDIRQNWEEYPYSRKSLGLPEDSFVMTTISNHLDNRLTIYMCQAIGEILKRCPQAVYAPMGDCLTEDKWRRVFADYNVNDRVIFLGSCKTPSQYARSMNLYLNEFPFGSGLAILDAMAAGCPVVSMYDEKGPQQARYAATYFGIDYVIRTGNIEDYVNLACQLIQNPDMYKKWSIHAIQQYEKRMNVKQYVKQFELIIEQFIDYYQKNKH